MGIGIAGHGLAGPITHWGHRHAGRGFGALGINIGVPLGAGLLGLGLGAIGGGDFGAFIGAGIGGFTGFVLAPIIDVAALAYDPIPANDTPDLSERVSLVPVLGPTYKGLHVGVQF
jgi:hypothetical protein